MSRETSFGDQQFHGRSSDASFKQGTVFTIMSFDEKNNDTYSVIKDECAKIGLIAERADEGTGSGIIYKNITDSIENAEFLIVDLTDEKPNVYYELGYAHGAGNEAEDILLIAKKGTKLHFDVAPLMVQEYSSTEELRKIINKQLKMMIEITRNQ